jgi:alkaline phosphatase
MKVSRYFRPLVSTACTLLLALSFTMANAGPPKSKQHYTPPKYIFYFIGDGMASVQIHAAEAYLASLQARDDTPGAIKTSPLAMSQFPVQGMITTYADNRFITGSAAAGTALACGKKTSIGTIAMDPLGTTPYPSIAELAKAKGMKVGIVSSVSIDHATPAVFYAHQPSRQNYHEISMELANSDFDYFAGGGFKKPVSETENAIETAQANGFSIVTTREELAAVEPGARTIAYNHTLAGGASLFYEVDRPYDHISLAEFTAEGIRLLDNSNGFFMMVEGGKIDWACHANDARASIDDTIAFDNAVGKAIAFYNAHPGETLIVVTADHECGGLTLGFAGTGYDTAFELLAGQSKSYEAFQADLDAYFESNSSTDMDAEMWTLVNTSFGLDGNSLTLSTDDDLTEYEKARLESAFDMSRDNITPSTDEDRLLYGSYEPFIVTLTHTLNRKAGIAWNSYSHTGVPVPVLAMGKSAGVFNGFYDNTDVAKKLAMAMDVEFTNYRRSQSN